MITIKNVTKTYNKGASNAFEALHEVNLEIPEK